MTRLQDWGARQADARPDAPAIVFGNERVTYGALEQASNRLARALIARGCVRGDRVALLIPKSPRAITSMLAVLKADCAYTPIDLQNPSARVARVIEALEPRVLLATNAAREIVAALAQEGRLKGVALGWLEDDVAAAPAPAPAAFTLADVGACDTGPVESRNDERDLAHILFTSGSTGVPKGVMIAHASVVRFVEWAVRYFSLGPGDRVSGHSPLHFDLSTFDVFGAFAAGATLYPVAPEMNILPHKLAEFIRQAQLTQWFSVPSILLHMAKCDVVRQDDFPALKRLLWCGEAFPTPGLIHWMRRLPHVTFTNLYGPTETTIASSYYRVPACPTDERRPVPIGTGCDGEELLVLDERLEPLPAGEIGELYIRGVGLSPGYWRDPDKTRAAFVPNPRAPEDRLYRTGDLARVDASGEIVLLGRVDSQIKTRGYRIELGEVEAALHALDAVRECAVVAVASDGFEGTTLGCAYVTGPAADPTPAGLRERLAERLPPYMLPTRWRRLERLPLNANGKVDRPAVRELLASGAGQQS